MRSMRAEGGEHARGRAGQRPLMPPASPPGAQRACLALAGAHHMPISVKKAIESLSASMNASTSAWLL